MKLPEFIKENKVTMLTIGVALAAAIGVAIGIKSCAVKHEPGSTNFGELVREAEQATDAPSESEPMRTEAPQTEPDEGSPPSFAPDKYLNTGVVTVTDKHGGTFSLGAATDGVAGFVLNPTYSGGPIVGSRTGYYFVTDYRTKVITSSEYSADTTSPNVVVDWAYDKVAPAAYVDPENFGAAWVVGSGTPPDITMFDMNISAVNLETGNIISTFTAELSKNDSGQFGLTALYDTDISVMAPDKAKAIWDSGKNMTTAYEALDIPTVRQQLIDKAIEEINSGRYIDVEEDFKPSLSTVALVNKLWHLHCWTPDKERLYTGMVDYPVWAVTINSRMPEVGHYTLYFTAESMECIGFDYAFLTTEEELKGYAGEISYD